MYLIYDTNQNVKKNQTADQDNCSKIVAKKMANGFQNWLMKIPNPLASVANAFFSLRPPLEKRVKLPFYR